MSKISKTKEAESRFLVVIDDSVVDYYRVVVVQGWRGWEDKEVG